MKIVLPAWVAKSMPQFDVEDNQKLPIVTDRDCTPIDETLAKKIVLLARRNGNARVSRNNRHGGPGALLETVIKEAYKKSKEQGFLTTDDLASIAGLSEINQNAGTTTFKQVVRELFKQGHLTRSETARASNKIGLSDINDEDIEDVSLEDL